MTIFTESKPKQTEAHEEVIGAFLADAGLFLEHQHQLSPNLFQDYAWLYQIILEVHETEGLTFKGVADRCGVDQIKLLHDLRGSFFNENRLPNLIQKMKKRSLSQQLQTLSREIVWRMGEGVDADEVLREVQKQAYALFTTESEKMSDPSKDVDEWAEYMLSVAEDPSKAFGMMPGIKSLDAITTGFHRHDLSVIGARTSMGKTAFMLEIILRLNKAGYKCGVFSLEMGKKQLYNRMMANMMQVSFEQFRSGRLAKNHYETMITRKNELKSIFVDDTRGISADYIADVMRRLKRTQGLDFVVVDYLQDVKEQGETNDNGGSALSRICRKLRAAAQENDCHVMGLSQVARAVEERKDKRPGNADLSGSTGIETSADVIALLYREEYYDPSTNKQNILEVNFTKQRNGKLGKVELYYDRECQRIYELSK